MANVELTEIEAAWLAGIMEGDGCFTLHFGKNAKGTPRLALAMTDQDIVDRVAVLLKTESRTTDWRTKGNKAIWRTTLARLEDLKYTLEKIYPFMGVRRKQRIDELLTNINGRQPSQT